MRKLLLAASLFASASGAQAETADAQSTRYTAEIARVTQSCEIQPARQRFLSDASDFTMTTTITGWTGGCVEGKRDGHGALTARTETVDDKPMHLWDEKTFSFSDETLSASSTSTTISEAIADPGPEADRLETTHYRHSGPATSSPDDVRIRAARINPWPTGLDWVDCRRSACAGTTQSPGPPPPRT